MLSDEEVVRDSYAVTARNLHDLMLAIAVECSPLNLVGDLGPVEASLITLVTYEQCSALVVARKAHNKGSDLMFRVRSVNVSLELARRTGVDLQYLSVLQKLGKRCLTLSLYSIARTERIPREDPVTLGTRIWAMMSMMPLA